MEFLMMFTGHHDITAALRSLRRSPAFVAIAVLSLGLAIGLNTTMFALIDAIRRPYVPYAHPEELVSVLPWPQGKQFIRFPPPADGRDGGTTRPLRGHRSVGHHWNEH